MVPLLNDGGVGAKFHVLAAIILSDNLYSIKDKLIGWDKQVFLDLRLHA